MDSVFCDSVGALQSVLNAAARFDTLILVWARHTNAATPSLAAVSGTHWSQAGCAHLPMPAWSGATVYFRLHPARHRFYPPPSLVVIILTASDLTYVAVHCWRSCISGDWKPPLEQSATRRHLNSHADCFSEPPRNFSLRSFPSFLFSISGSVYHIQ